MHTLLTPQCQLVQRELTVEQDGCLYRAKQETNLNANEGSQNFE